MMNDADIMKMAIAESIEFLISVIRDKTLPMSDRIEAAAALLKVASLALD